MIANIKTAIEAYPLLILVGVTGAGKSTALESLTDANPKRFVLPDRRSLTDSLIIAHLQEMDNEPIELIRDRKKRFDYTRRYRALYPGGMAYALTQLTIDPARASGLLIFDGLRGEEEVTYAAQNLPDAYFIVLDVPDSIRIRRLLNRQDIFDYVETESASKATQVASFDALGVPEASALFTRKEEKNLIWLVNTGQVKPDELRSKLQIVTAERQNYDPQAGLAALQTVAPDRTLLIESAKRKPRQVARQIEEWLAQRLPLEYLELEKA